MTKQKSNIRRFIGEGETSFTGISDNLKQAIEITRELQRQQQLKSSNPKKIWKKNILYISERLYINRDSGEFPLIPKLKLKSVN